MTESAGSLLPLPNGPTPGRDFATGSPAADALTAALAEVRSAAYDIPNVIGGREVRTGRTAAVVTPHEHAVGLGHVHRASAGHVSEAVLAATEAARWWGRLPWEERVAPFLRAADMLETGPWRDRLTAAAMLELSKTRPEAEGDAVCETVDLLRATVRNMLTMYGEQPESAPGVRNHVEYRPLEGFVFAISPFNFFSTCNLAFGPAVLGNTVVWKPSESASLGAHLCLQLLREAGLPDGVVNVVYGRGPDLAGTALLHRDLAAVHFTGSTSTFRHIWRTVGENVAGYRNYPRLVGETGGKDFIVAHPSADLEALAAACVRGAFDYQGQKCAAASRLYVPRSLWPRLKERLVEFTRAIVVGDPTVPGTQLGAVINGRQYAKHAEALTRARAENLVLAGGNADDSMGWFVEPTVLEVDDPHSPFLTEELFAPVIAAYVYDDAQWEKTLRLVDESTPYGLTGAVFASDDKALAEADEALRYTAGNYCVNDKPTGAVVGQQPFGGSRASGTNDKVGTVWNLIRFASPRTVKRPDQPSRDPVIPN